MAFTTQLSRRSCSSAAAVRQSPAFATRVPLLRSSVSAAGKFASRQPQLIVCQAAAVEAAPAEAPAERTGKFHPSPLTQAVPSTYAIIEIGGHQMFVEPGKWYTCNRLKAGEWDINYDVAADVTLIYGAGRCSAGIGDTQNGPLAYPAEVGSKIRFGRVLALKQQDTLTVGKPYLEDVRIEAEILEELRGPKVIVYKMRPKKHYRRKNGHRQSLTKFMVTSISA